MSGQDDVRRLRRLLALQRRLEDRALTASRRAASAAAAAAQRVQRAREAWNGMAQPAGLTGRAAIGAAAHWRGLLSEAVDGAAAVAMEADTSAHRAAQDHARQQKRRERLDERLAAACRVGEREMIE